MALLIRNARVYAPKDLGITDVLMAAGKILAVGSNLTVSLPDLETVDAKGKILTPGFFDQHIHVNGGGGEGGFASREGRYDFDRRRLRNGFHFPLD